MSSVTLTRVCLDCWESSVSGFAPIRWKAGHICSEMATQMACMSYFDLKMRSPARLLSVGLWTGGRPLSAMILKHWFVWPIAWRVASKQRGMFCWPATSCLTAYMVLVKNKFSTLNHLLKVLHHQFKRLLYVEQEKKGRSLQGGLSEVRSRFDTWSVLVLQSFLDKAHLKPCPVILEIRTDISWFGGGGRSVIGTFLYTWKPYFKSYLRQESTWHQIRLFLEHLGVPLQVRRWCSTRAKPPTRIAGASDTITKGIAKDYLFLFLLWSLDPKSVLLFKTHARCIYHLLSGCFCTNKRK